MSLGRDEVLGADVGPAADDPCLRLRDLVEVPAHVHRPRAPAVLVSPWHPTLDRQVLLDALKQVTPYGQNNNPVRLTFVRERLQVDGSLQDVGRGAASVDAKYEGEGLTIAFNPVYLSDGVAAVDDNEAVIEVRDGLKPALIHGNDALAFMYLLMPVRLPG